MQIEIPIPRRSVELPVGFRDAKGSIHRTAEVRAVTGADELYIGMSREYNQHPNDMVYKLLLLGRCVTRIGEESVVTLSDVQQLHARDIRALEVAIYEITYGDGSVPKEEDGAAGG